MFAKMEDIRDGVGIAKSSNPIGRITRETRDDVCTKWVTHMWTFAEDRSLLSVGWRNGGFHAIQVLFAVCYPHGNILLLCRGHGADCKLVADPAKR